LSAIYLVVSRLNFLCEECFHHRFVEDKLLISSCEVSLNQEDDASDTSKVTQRVKKICCAVTVLDGRVTLFEPDADVAETGIVWEALLPLVERLKEGECLLSEEEVVNSAALVVDYFFLDCDQGCFRLVDLN